MLQILAQSMFVATRVDILGQVTPQPAPTAEIASRPTLPPLEARKGGVPYSSELRSAIP